MKNGKVNGAGKGCFYFHESRSVGRVNLLIYIIVFNLRNLLRYFM